MGCPPDDGRQWSQTDPAGCLTQLLLSVQSRVEVGPGEDLVHLGRPQRRQARAVCGLHEPVALLPDSLVSPVKPCCSRISALFGLRTADLRVPVDDLV